MDINSIKLKLISEASKMLNEMKLSEKSKSELKNLELQLDHLKQTYSYDGQIEEVEKRIDNLRKDIKFQEYCEKHPKYMDKFNDNHSDDENQSDMKTWYYDSNILHTEGTQPKVTIQDKNLRYTTAKTIDKAFANFKYNFSRRYGKYVVVLRECIKEDKNK